MWARKTLARGVVLNTEEAGSSVPETSGLLTRGARLPSVGRGLGLGGWGDPGLFWAWPEDPGIPDGVCPAGPGRYSLPACDFWGLPGPQLPCVSTSALGSLLSRARAGGPHGPPEATALAGSVLSARQHFQPSPQLPERLGRWIWSLSVDGGTEACSRQVL